MSLERPRVERVSWALTWLYVDWLVETGWPQPKALAWILRVLGACQNRN